MKAQGERNPGSGRADAADEGRGAAGWWETPLPGFDDAPVPLALLDRSGRMRPNAAFARFVESSPEDLAGSPLAGRFRATTAQEQPQLEALERGEPSPGESCQVLLAASRGQERPARLTWAASALPGGGQGVVVRLAPMAEVEGAGSERERLRFLRHLLSQTLVAFIEWDPEFHVVSWNRAAEEIFGYTAEEALGRHAGDLIGPEGPGRAAYQELLDHLQRVDDLRSGQNLNRTKEGREILCQWHIAWQRDEEGRRQGLASFCRDVTEEVRTLEAVEESEARLRTIVEELPLPVAIESLDRDRFLFANPLYGELAGMSLKAIYDSPTANLLLNSDTNDAVRQRLMQGDPVTLEDVPGTRADGEELRLNVTMRQVQFEGEDAMLAIVTDLTELRRAQEELAKVASVVEASSDFIAILSPDGRRVLHLNSAGRRIMGLGSSEKVADLSVEQLHEGVDRERMGQIWNTLRRGEPWRGEVVFQNRATGRPIQTLFRAFPVFGREAGVAIGYAVVATDITQVREAEQEQRRMEEQMQHVQRLEGLGVMAGGIAHDFNNLLVGILGNTGLARSELGEDHPVHEYLERAERAARHATELTAQMLTYSGKTSVDTTTLDLAALVEEVHPLLLAALKEGVELELEFEELLPPVEGNTTRLRQVVMNLVVNASDAIAAAQQEAGTISLRLFTVRVDPSMRADFLLGQSLEDGEFVVLEVEDDGVGMAPRTREKIFDPFFTTKFTGRGLGLATVFGIVRSHRGGIVVRSEEGVGTTFRVFLPVNRQGAREQDPPEVDDIEQWRHQGRVLVADDEEAVRDVARLMLERHGLHVITVHDGVEAVEVFEEQGQSIDLVLLDMMMPRMNGDEALRLIRERNPSMPVVLTSGYTEHDATSELQGEAYAYLQKPFTPEELSRIVRRELERNGG